MAVCPNCGEDNPKRARLCMMCGTALAEAPREQAEERKVVSVLFVDLVGFTARSHDLDPEDVRAALAPYHRLLKTEIERFGGTVEKFIGDAVMAVFGAPIAHEDDAERAVRSALRITEAIEELNQENPNLDLSIRAAINTGEGLVNLSARPQYGESMVTGDVVNTASRLQGVAPVNGIVVGEITYRSTKDFINYEEMDSVSVKGKPDPIPLWRAVSARGRFGVDVETRYRTPFIGRDFDLATLKTAYQRTLRESSLQLVTLVGEPGVGKSRLLSEFASYVDEQSELVTWRQGRSLPYGEGITFWALGEIVKAQAGISESDSPETAAHKIAAALSALAVGEADRAWLQTRLGHLAGMTSGGGSTEKEESFTAWLRFLEAIATKGPLVLVFEDLHWADSSMLEFIEHIVEWSTGVPVLILCTARPELFEKQSAWAAGSRNATTISLSPLTDSETAQLISALLSQAVLPAEIHAALLERAGGNPLYAEEFIRMLNDRDVLQQKGRVLKLAPDAQIPVPDNVQALIAARLDTLSPERKSLLHDAAVVGKVFWSGVVATLSGLDDMSIRRSMQELVRKELVRPARTSSVEGQQEYSFWHALIRDVAYGQMPRLHRAEKHQGVALWLEGVAGDRVADHAEVLAHHYESAMELLASSGMNELAAELVEQAVRCLRLAADRAADLDAGRAEQYILRALRLLPAGAPARVPVLVRAGRICQIGGNFQEAERYLEEAITEAQAHGDAAAAAEAMVHLGPVMWFTGRTERMDSLEKEAITILEGLPPGVPLAIAYTYAAEGETFAGRYQDGLDLAEKALDLAEAFDLAEWAVEARADRGDARCGLGDIRGLEDAREAVRAGLDLGVGDATSVAYGVLGEWQWNIQGPRQARRTREECIAFSERRGLIPAMLVAQSGLLEVLFDLGDWDAVLDAAPDLIARAKGGPSEPIALLTYAHVRLHRGQVNEAASLRERFLPQARRMADLQVIVPALVIAAQIHSAQGEQGAAVSMIEEWERATAHSDPWRARYLPPAARVLLRGDAAGTKDLASGLAVTATRDCLSVLTGKAFFAEVKGISEQARDLYQEAAQGWADYGQVLEEGQAYLGLARCLLALGDREDATEPLHKASEIFSRLGAVQLISETDTYLDQAEAAS